MITLNDDCLGEVFFHLPIPAFSNLVSCCHRFREIAGSDHLWKRFAARDLHANIEDPEVHNWMDWYRRHRCGGWKAPADALFAKGLTFSPDRFTITYEATGPTYTQYSFAERVLLRTKVHKFSVRVVVALVPSSRQAIEWRPTFTVGLVESSAIDDIYRYMMDCDYYWALSAHGTTAQARNNPVQVLGRHLQDGDVIDIEYNGPLQTLQFRVGNESCTYGLVECAVGLRVFAKFHLGCSLRLEYC